MARAHRLATAHLHVGRLVVVRRLDVLRAAHEAAQLGELHCTNHSHRREARARARRHLYLTLGESTSKASTWSGCMAGLRTGKRARQAGRGRWRAPAAGGHVPSSVLGFQDPSGQTDRGANARTLPTEGLRGASPKLASRFTPPVYRSSAPLSLFVATRCTAVGTLHSVCTSP